MTLPSARARELLASAVAAEGSGWANAAESIRAGYTNVWIGPAMRAIDAVLRLVPDDEADDPEEGRT